MGSPPYWDASASHEDDGSTVCHTGSGKGAGAAMGISLV